MVKKLSLIALLVILIVTAKVNNKIFPNKTSNLPTPTPTVSPSPQLKKALTLRHRLLKPGEGWKMVCDICGNMMEVIRRDDGTKIYLCSKCDYEFEKPETTTEDDEDEFAGQPAIHPWPAVRRLS